MCSMNEPRRGPAGEALAAEEIARIQDTTQRNIATSTPPRAERVRRLADAFLAVIQDGHTFGYELGFDPVLVRAATDAGFDLGWEPEDIMEALLRVRTKVRRAGSVGTARPGGTAAGPASTEVPPASMDGHPEDQP